MADQPPAGPSPVPPPASQPTAPHSAPPARPTGPAAGGGGDQRPLDPEAVQTAGRLVIRFGVVALAAVLASGLPVPWGLASGLFAVVAIVVGVLAIIATVKARLRPPPVVMLSFGLVLMGVLLLMVLAQVIFYPAVVADQSCRTSAVTDRAVTACDDQQRGRVLDQLFGR